jgi:hypothetical protein
LADFDSASKRGFQDQEAASSWPDFNFRKLPLSQTSRKQLAAIYENVRRSGNVTSSKSKLLTDFVVKNAYVPSRGLYVPIADDVFLTGKLPTFSEQLALNPSAFPQTPSPTQFFTNALLIPLWDACIRRGWSR